MRDAASPWPAPNEVTEFDDLVRQALHALAEKDERNDREHGLPETSRFVVNDQSIDFYDRSEAHCLTASVIFIGTYAESAHSWMWAWCNESFPAAAREESLVLKELTRATGQMLFSEETLDDISPLRPWKFTALAVKHLGALGSYSYGDEPRVYVAIMKFSPPLH